MFRSSSFHKIDAKGRVIIPARFKDELKRDNVNGVVISRKDGCIYAYTFKEWEKVEAKILAVKTPALAEFRRLFLGNSCECMCDKQDRILIPQTLREYAGLGKEIVLVGNLDHFEIWDRERWETVSSEMEQKLNEKEAQEEIASLGI